MINIKAGLNFILLFFLNGLLSVEPEVKNMRKREGDSISLQSHLIGEQPSPQILWSFDTGSSKKIIAQLIRGEFTTDYSQGFTDRLQLDRQTGSLNISDINTKDTGVYHIQIIANGNILEQRFNLIVYSPVSKPVITNITQSRSVRCLAPCAMGTKNCSVLCFVKNEREVTLSWQREGETLFNTSSPDLNATLYLPLEIKGNSATYSCVAENPVSNHVVPLQAEALCPLDPDSNKTRSNILPAVLISLLLMVVIGFAVVIAKCQKCTKLEPTGKVMEPQCRLHTKLLELRLGGP
ncbi:hypothetical protein SKAU_G00393180 [Synaphobranchus kaupii]|uniref:Ig-like domain-containing protein n=1 Tax=Synaphobranchus kaupii TaxID=118154 RepID=A0A9Q1EC09_SYNKA|nr:hypothetical protein SKAU_G00393180 [Synaphobranchus kaupii]